MIRRILSILGALLAVASPAAAQLRPVAATTLRTTDTTANSLIVGGATGATTGTGGIKAGQVSVNGVGIIGTDGRIPAISTTYFASLSGANLTGILETSITDGSLLARLAADETITGAWTVTGANFTVSNTAPIYRWQETGVTADNTRWRQFVDTETFRFQACTDNEGTCNNIFSVDRTGATVDSFALAAAQVYITGCTGLGCASTPSISTTGDTDSGLSLGATGGAFGVVKDGVTYFSVSPAAAGGITSAGPLAATVLTGGSVALTATSVSGTAGLFDRSGGDGTVMDFRSGGVSQGTVSISGATTAYNTFLGAHYTQLRPGQEEPEPGTVVVADGVIPSVRRLGAVPDDAERFVYVKPSTRRNQKAVYGLWFADLGQTAKDMSWGDPDAEVYQVAGLGLTTGWVTDTCGNIAAGDFLASSPVEGLAERQCTVGAGGKPGYDPVNRDYTLGKALVDVDFSKVAPDADGVRTVRIPLTLKAS